MTEVTDVLKNYTRPRPDMDKVIEQRKPVYMTPYLPPEAVKVARNWQKNNKQPAFVKAFDVMPGQCRNCADMRRVYLVLCASGPHPSTYLSRKGFTYYEGDAQFGRGWYVIDETMVFGCSECGERK